MLPRPPTSTLFPYTTLFRSCRCRAPPRQHHAPDPLLLLRQRLLHSRGRANAITAALERSEEHTSELQSQSNLVCRLLLEKKKKPLKQYLASSSLCLFAVIDQ